MTLRTESLTKAHVLALAALHGACFGPQESWSEDQIAGSLALPTTSGHGLWDGESLLGFILIQRVMDEVEILTLAVDPARRRQGLGHGLVSDLLDQLPQGTSVFLEVAQDNAPAIALYEACGFTLLGRRPAYYRRGETLVDALNYRLLVNG